MNNPRRTNILLWAAGILLGLIIMTFFILKYSSRKEIFQSEEQKRKFETCSSIWDELWRVRQEENKSRKLNTQYGDSVAEGYRKKADQLDSFYNQCMKEYEQKIYDLP